MNVGRASTTISRAGRILKEGKDIERAEDKVEQLKKQVEELQTFLTEETERAKASIDPLLEKLEPFIVKPKKIDISILFLALSWAPYWQDKKGGLKPAW
jgi:CRISPR/Cas system CSM-associated protein Csm2 small subunit